MHSVEHLNTKIEHPSGSVRTSVLQHISRALLAGALILPSASQTANQRATSAPVEKNDTEVLDIEKLIRDLDDNEFQIRHRAEQELTKIALIWPHERKAPFPLRALLDPKRKSYSLEQTNTLERIYETYAQAERMLLWEPTRFTMPPAWNTKDITMAMVMTEMDKQCREHIRIQNYSKEDLEELKQISIRPDDLSFEDIHPEAVHLTKEEIHGRSFWEIVEILRAKHDGKVEYYRAHNNSLIMRPACKGDEDLFYRATDGSLCATLNGDICFPNRYCLGVIPEQKIPLGKFIFVKAEGITDTGKTFGVEPEEKSTDANYVFDFLLPKIKGADTANLSITLKILGYQNTTIHLKDITKNRSIQTRLLKMQYEGTKGTREHRFDQKMIWETKISMRSDSEYASPLYIGSRCTALDKDQKPIPLYSMGWGFGPWTTFRGDWSFDQEPHSIELSIPDQIMEITKTFTFRNVRLPKGEK